MSNHNEFLKQMLQLIGQLVENAKKLQEQSASIAECELEELQEKQELLIKELVALDALIKKTAPTKVSPMLQKEIEKELLHFQQINHDFVDHLRNRLSLIQWNHAPRKGE